MYTENVELKIGKNYFKLDYTSIKITLDGMSFCIEDSDKRFRIVNIDLLDRYGNTSIEIPGISIGSLEEALELVEDELMLGIDMDVDIGRMLKEC